MEVNFAPKTVRNVLLGTTLALAACSNYDYKPDAKYNKELGKGKESYIKYCEYPQILKNKAEKIDYSEIGNKNGYIDAQEVPDFFKELNEAYKNQKITSDDYFDIKENLFQKVKEPYIVRVPSKSPLKKEAQKAAKGKNIQLGLRDAGFGIVGTMISLLIGCLAGIQTRSKRFGAALALTGTLCTGAVIGTLNYKERKANVEKAHKTLIRNNVIDAVNKEYKEFKAEKSMFGK
ncbi:hypothetical protein [Helicobacter rodentium]|uniref:hypothetical protein n=1 Tax=Helicobacter rodentium TaxID=59617 RepID=UPI00261BD9A3|nr:hypothetical protein [Helicobacter rodentium]